MEAQEYKDVLAEHGRRVANRVAFSSLPKGEEQADGQWAADFYALYGPEDSLPEHERMRPSNPANAFDPSGWLAHYRNHPADERSPIYHVTESQSKWWFDQLVGAREQWGAWVIDFLYKGLVLDASNEVYDAIADDQGEFAIDDGCRLCAWQPGWRGWTAWANSLTPDDISVAQQVLKWLCSRSFKFTHQWPLPGTPEAEALVVSIKEKK